MAGWAPVSVSSLMGFLLAEMNICRIERRASQEEQKETPIDWRRPLLYGTYTLFDRGFLLRGIRSLV